MRKTMVCLVFISFIVFGCKKQKEIEKNVDFGNSSVSGEFSLSKAREWYEKNLGMQTKSTISNGILEENKPLRFTKITPAWEKGIEIQNSLENVVQVPILFEKGVIFGLKQGKQSNSPVVGGRSSLLIIKKRNSDSTEARLIHFYPDSDISTNEIRFNKIPTDYNGKVFHTDVTGNLIAGFVYSNGKIVKRIADQPQAKLKSNPGVQTYSTRNMDAPWPPAGCDITTQDWYTRECTYWSDGSITCTEWQYDYTYYIMSCDGTGGGGGGGGGSEPSYCTNAMDDMLSDGTVTSQMVAITSVPIDANTRNKTYKWKILSGLTSSVYSFEEGVHYKTSDPNPNLAWKWQSLTHTSVALNGYIAGGDAEFTTSSSSATIGDYNSSMSVVLKGTFTLDCFGAPFTKHKIYPSSTIYIHVND